MAGELALLHILKSDSEIQSFCGNSPVRIFPFEIPQTTSLPALVVRGAGTEPNGTKDGPSELDFDRVQVLIYDNEFNADTYKLENRVRELCDRPAVSGVVNGVDLESSSFEDRDTFNEKLIDKPVNVIEHIYKTIIKR
jgi:hypothetical protein